MKVEEGLTTLVGIKVSGKTAILGTIAKANFLMKMKITILN